MRPTYLISTAAAVFVLSLTLAFADTPDTTARFDPSLMRECPQADGSALYTNKDLPGCKLMTLKELSVVPSLENMPTYVPPTSSAMQHYDIPPMIDRYLYPTAGATTNVPDWARDWHASVASSGSIQAEVCSKYGEWVHLNEKTRGGFWFGADPSYGGDLSGRNQRGASYSFYDNTRYHALARIFGTGFVPVGCL